MKHLKNIKSFEDLKEQFKKLARVNHPDAGGDDEIMKEINSEYDQLFPIWKHRYNKTVTEPTNETADTSRRKFYSQNGWEGNKHDWSRSTKEVASIIRNYVKEVYPTYKFSVRFSSASMCSEVHIELKEAPHVLYKIYEELTENEINDIRRKLVSNQLFNLDSWYDYELKNAILEAWEKSDFYKVYNDLTTAVIKDIDREVSSYNFDDCDSMTDYFHVDFYYFGCKVSNDFKIVEKAARINQQNETKKETGFTEIEDNTNNYTYEIKEDIDTRDNSKIFVVKVIEKLDRDEYLTVNNNMKSLGGYYSKFKHGFIFKKDPAELLKGGNYADNSTKTPESKEQVKQEYKQAKQKILNDKINKQINSIQKKVDGLSGDYKTNTWKRMNEQASRDSKIESFKNEIELLQYLIDTLENRSLSPLEENLIISSFRIEIYSYYTRHNAYLEKKGTALKEISFPEINREYPDSWMNKEVPTKQERLQKANIYNTNDLLKAVAEYKVIYDLINKPCNYTEKKIKQLEREYKMQQKGDINFTPLKVVEQMIQYAKINENSRVLEPSAGIGNIADQIKQITSNLNVCEQMYHFCELLKLKGHNVVGNNFLEYNTDQKYDAVIMNPPFSDEQNHIKHAYELLKPDGILVSISSPHWTFANDKNSVEFRQWLENETYFTNDLPSGTFEMTGVTSKIIVIEKHIQQSERTA
jgi:hypothetical protein